MPEHIVQMCQQIDFAAAALASMSPIPADYADDLYWPRGRVQTFRIVGEDEADPKAGTVSFASPMARALMGSSVGEVVKVGGGEVEIVGIG